MRRLSVTLPPDLDAGIERFRAARGHEVAVSQVIQQALREWIDEHAPPPAPQLATADALRPFVGQWVAVRAGQVIGAENPEALLDWLASIGEKADVMLPVPGPGSGDRSEWPE